MEQLLSAEIIPHLVRYTIYTRLREASEQKSKGETTMNDFMRIAYSTEITSGICYDKTDYDCSYVYEYKPSYSEYRRECGYAEEYWSGTKNSAEIIPHLIC